MRNNKGFGTFEIMTIIVLVLVVFAGLSYVILQGANKQKFVTMRDNALSFSKTVGTNIASFHYSNTVYLGEAIDEGLLKPVKSPFGGGNCDESQSRMDTKDGKPYITFRCGKYLINDSTFDDPEAVPIYEVSDWDTKKIKGDDVEKTKLYNCLDGDKEVFDEYYEELYFVYQYNKKYGTDAYFARDVVDDYCELVSKDFYRTIKKVS